VSVEPGCVAALLVLEWVLGVCPLEIAEDFPVAFGKRWSGRYAGHCRVIKGTSRPKLPKSSANCALAGEQLSDRDALSCPPKPLASFLATS
jgi:hypothetical protein